MKTTITFETTEQKEALLAIQSAELWSMVWDLRDKVRDNLKYDNELTMDEVYTELCTILDKYGLD